MQPWSTQSSPTPLISRSPPSVETVLWWLITCFDLGLFHLHEISRAVTVLNIYGGLSSAAEVPGAADPPWVSPFRCTGRLCSRLRRCFFGFKLHLEARVPLNATHSLRLTLRWQSWKLNERNLLCGLRKLNLLLQNQFLKLLPQHSNHMGLLHTWEETGTQNTVLLYLSSSMTCLYIFLLV